MAILEIPPWYKIDQYNNVYTAARAQFASDLMGITGAANTRLLITPNKSNTTTTIDLSPNGYTCTWAASIASQLSQLGLGENQSYNGTTQFGSVPDAANLSFGNGTVDSPFTVITFANITSVAAQRTLLGKYGGSNREYRLYLFTDQKLYLDLFDESAGANPYRGSNGTVTISAMTMYGATYAGTGGATAANGIALYINGALIASTANNAASYVAMENLGSTVGIGSDSGGSAASPVLGSVPLSVLIGAEMSAAQMLSIKNLFNDYFGLAL